MVEPPSRRAIVKGAALVVAGIGLAAAAALGRAVRRGRGVREGTLHGGLPYLAVGDGPPLVVFSGLTAEHANPTGLERRFQLQSLKPLARHFTVYAVNRKPGLPAGATIADLAGHYAEAIARQFPGPVLVHGISTGGSIAQQFAIDHPQLVRRLVLAATACRLSSHGRAVQRRYAELTRRGRPRRAYAALGPTLAATVAGGRAFAALMWLVGGGQGVEDPSDMLVAGARDRLHSPELFRQTAARIPGARLALYPGKSHSRVLTHRPAIAEIVAFLTADDRPGA
jgi:pimeloyl-ACP methyl ester carboxylesterase